MRRTSLLASAAVLLTVACDPTGNVGPSSPSAKYRFVNAVADAADATVKENGATIVSSVGFGTVSSSQSISANANILVVTRDSDGFLLGTDTVTAVSGKRYTMFGLGTAGNFTSLVLADDTVFADSGKFKVRFVHGVDDQDGFGLDLYVTASATDISGVTPQVASLQYGAASPYFQNDTSFRRLRVTLAGQTTLLLDTTFAATFPDSQVVTVVASDKFNGGPPPRFTVVVDRAP
jgi:hypothetical protein